MEISFHLAAFSSSIANGATLAQVSAVSDQILTVQNNSFILPKNGQILAAAMMSADLNDGQIDTPSARDVGLPSVNPLNIGATVPTVPGIYDMVDGPMPIPQGDAITLRATQGNAGAQTVAGLMWIGFGRRAAPPGKRYRLKGTGAITGVSGAWASGTLTLSQTLPVGTYSVVGLDVQGTNLMGARLIFPGASYRPGVLCRNAGTGVPYPRFRDGSFGEYGRFYSVNTPNLEIFAVGANTAQTVFLDVVQLNPSPN